jgi:hypothetical protein
MSGIGKAWRSKRQGYRSFQQCRPRHSRRQPVRSRCLCSSGTQRCLTQRGTGLLRGHSLGQYLPPPPHSSYRCTHSRRRRRRRLYALRPNQQRQGFPLAMGVRGCLCSQGCSSSLCLQLAMGCKRWLSLFQPRHCSLLEQNPSSIVGFWVGRSSSQLRQPSQLSQVGSQTCPKP